MSFGTAGVPGGQRGPEADAFERCMTAGGVAVFPADTVYGLACDPSQPSAVERLYRLKRRAPGKPAAVMFFAPGSALEALPEIGDRTRRALHRLLPGSVTVLLANPRRLFPFACGDNPETLGLRVVDVPALAGVRWPVLQSSANVAGGPDARRLQDVPESIRTGADMVIDGGELPGTPSTVIDLREYERTGEWSIVRHGRVADDTVRAALDPELGFDPRTYDEEIRADIPAYETLQEEVVAASGSGAQRILELGTGTGETARRLLARHPQATLVGVDASQAMLAAARARLDGERVRLVEGRLQDPLPAGEYDLVVSVLAVHHLESEAKRDLFARVHAALVPGGRFVLGDVVVPLDPNDREVELTPGFDLPEPVSDLVVGMAQAGFEVEVGWTRRDLAVLVGRAPAR